MITIFASIVGFIGSLIPEIIKLFKDHQDKKHQLEILNRHAENKSYRGISALEKTQKQISEQAALYSTYKSGVAWVDAINGSVRPVLAYFFFIIYAGVKLIQYKAICSYAPEHIELIWNGDDQAIFAGIISFYFGQRTFSKIRR
jgi:hypothetical protein